MIGITVQFAFHVPLTGEQVAALVILSQHHYDARCRDASGETGFLTRWNRVIAVERELEMADPSPTHVTWGELDTCCKLLEMRGVASSSLLTPEASQLCHGMARDFGGALRLAGSKYSEWQAEYV